jgi:hypothetical protein
MLPFAGRLSPSILSGHTTESIGKPGKIDTMSVRGCWRETAPLHHSWSVAMADRELRISFTGQDLQHFCVSSAAGDVIDQ